MPEKKKENEGRKERILKWEKQKRESDSGKKR